ncbi:MAG: sigma-70 family RNA polymerase sigma factor [Oscillospiraceae bacterium]|nr:sigma-70 family RNA polymerase sigma factor [Oscillospiraceae bacterium]
MNESITFGELLSMIPNNITGKKPTEKYLRENETVIAVSPDKRVTAYRNGYASYKGYPNTIVLNIHDCFFCTYEAKKWIESVKKEQALKLKWYLLIFMRGEEELALNQCYREETRHRYKNDEDAFCEEVPDREPPPDIQVHSKIFVEELMQPLTERQKQVTQLQYVYQYTHDEISVMLKIKRPVVTKHKNKAVSRMKKLCKSTK